MDQRDKQKVPPRERQLAGGVARNPNPVKERVMDTHKATPSVSPAQGPPSRSVYLIRKRGRAFAIFDHAGNLLYMTVYLKGPFGVIRRLGGVASYVKLAKGRHG
jgi:hypothetical protein